MDDYFRKECDMRLNVGDIVYFREKVVGDTNDDRTGLYIPYIFEEMVGNYYVVNHINPNGRIKLRDEFHNHSTNNYDFYYAFKNYVFEPHWFDISNDSSIRDDDIEKAEFFFEV